MFRPSSWRAVVFTQGYPFLADFARRNFLPEHPLARSPLWLDENDFVLCNAMAERKGVPSPLQINSLSHHPELSPYAVGGGSAASKRKKAKPSSKHRKRKGSAERATEGMGAEQHTRGDESAAEKDGTHSAESSEEGIGHSGLPASTHWGMRAAVAKAKGAGAPVASKRPYQVPVCAIEVYRHLYLYNMEQMTTALVLSGPPEGLLRNADAAAADGGNKDLGQEERREVEALGSASPTRHKPPLSVEERMRYTLRVAQQAQHERHHGVESDDTPPLYNVNTAAQEGPVSPSLLSQASDVPFQWDAAITPGGDTWGRAAREEEGARMLRARFPNPSDSSMASTTSASLGGAAGLAGSRGFRGRDSAARYIAYSVKSGKPYHFNMQHDLQRVSRMCGYRSQYWGTIRQWAAVGAWPQMKARPHLAYIPVKTKLVHISLIEGAEALLQRSYISAKTGVFSPFFDLDTDLLERVKKATRRADAPIFGFESSFLSETHGAERVFSSRQLQSQLFQPAIHDDMRVNRYAIPLYFSGAQLIGLGLSLKPHAQGVDVKALTTPLEPPLLGQGFSTDNSTNGDGIDENFGNAAEVPAAELADSPDALRSVPLSAGSTSSPPYRAVPVRVEEVKFYYHLSQVHFPRGFTIPLRVVTAELEARPGVALHGVSGRVLAFPELTAEHVRNTYPDVGAVLLAPSRDKPIRKAAEASSHGRETETIARHTDTSSDPLVQRSVENNNNNSVGTNASALPKDTSLRDLPHGEKTESVLDGVDMAQRERLLAMSDADFAALVRSRVDPTNADGRSLWFLAEDVLQLDGIVDANSTPVEVHDAPRADAAGQAGKDGEETNEAKGGSGMYAMGALDSAGASAVFPKALYNVECLLSPEEGLRKVNQRV